MKKTVKNLLSNWGGMVGLALTTSMILMIVFIALPQTETILPNLNFNLKTVEDPWRKTFIVEVESPTEEELATVKSILSTRLRKLHVDDFSITKRGTATISDNTLNFPGTVGSEESFSIPLHITVETNKQEDHVQTLLTNSGNFELLAQKPDVNFNDPENPYNQMIASNYNSSGITGADFRSISIKKLLDAGETYSYFIIPKTWPIGKSHDKVVNFLNANSGESIGVSFSGYVRPMQVNSNNINLLTIWLSPDPIEAQLYNIMLNTKPLPTNLTFIESVDEQAHSHDVDFIKTFIAFVTVILLSGVLLYLALPKTHNRLTKVVTYYVTISILLCGWITIYKLFSIESDFVILPLTAFAINTIATILTLAQDPRKVIYNIVGWMLLLTLVASLIGNKPILTFIYTLVPLAIALWLTQLGTTWYVNKLKGSFLK